MALLFKFFKVSLLVTFFKLADYLHFQILLIFNIFKVSWLFKFSKSAGYLHFQSQLIVDISNFRTFETRWILFVNIYKVCNNNKRDPYKRSGEIARLKSVRWPNARIATYLTFYVEIKSPALFLGPSRLVPYTFLSRKLGTRIISDEWMHFCSCTVVRFEKTNKHRL